MEIKGEVKRLRFYISNTDKLKHAPLYEMIVFAAKRDGLAGATVFKGVMAFGSSSIVHSIKFWEIEEKIPVVIEIVDESKKIEVFKNKMLQWFQKLHYGCLITIDATQIVLYKHGAKKKGLLQF
jgi:PII-like signaling protein